MRIEVSLEVISAGLWRADLLGDLWLRWQNEPGQLAGLRGTVELDGEYGGGDGLRCQSIVVLNSAEDREGDQPPVSRGPLLQLRVRLGNGMRCLRWTRAVVEGNEVTCNSPNMIFAQEYEVIQGVLAKCPVEAFKLSIRIWCLIRSRYSLDLQHLLEPKIELAAISFPFRAHLRMPKLPEDSVVVVKEKAR